MTRLPSLEADIASWSFQRYTAVPARHLFRLRRYVAGNASFAPGRWALDVLNQEGLRVSRLEPSTSGCGKTRTTRC